MNNELWKKRLASLDLHSPLYLRLEDKDYGGGDISDLYSAVDKAAETGFSFIQLNPIQDTGLHVCPYLGVSIFSFNPVYLDVNKIPENIAIANLKKNRSQTVRNRKLKLTDYRGLYKFKITILREYFLQKQHRSIDFNSYDKNILAYAVYSALKNKYRSSWFYWPTDFKTGQVSQILKKYPEIWPEVEFFLFAQEIMKNQWTELKRYAGKKHIQFITDKPIYPMYDSADVWANQELFYLNKNGSLRFVSGCNLPTDPFGEQIWGHAVYEYKEKPDEVIDFFVESIRHMAQISPVIRLDHALGLIWKYYTINKKTKKGRYHPALKHKLFSVLDKKFPEVSFIAEDLGFVSKKLITEPLLEHNIIGMRCPQWYIELYHLNTQKYPKECIAQTSNHDIGSVGAWWHKLPTKFRKIYYNQIGFRPATEKETVDEIIKLVFNSEATLVSIPLRDVLGDRRLYNHPGTTKPQNWRTRMHVPICEVNFSKISEIIKHSGRDNGHV